MSWKNPTPEEIKEKGETGARMHPYDYELLLQRLERRLMAPISVKRNVVEGGCIVIRPSKFAPKKK